MSTAILTIQPLAASSFEQIADLNPGSVGSFPSNLTVYASNLFFNAYTLNTGRELWKYDGTNVTLVADINETKDDIGTGTMEGNDSLPAWLTPFNDSLYFAAYDPRRGAELWRYTGSGVERVADINPDLNDTVKISPNSSWPANLIVFDNALYFTANNSSTRTNYELWKYNGTTASMVTNIHADLMADSSSYPNSLTIFNGSLYFMADNGVDGFEIWKHNGAETILLANINPGAAESSSYPKQFTHFKDQLLFVATRDDIGYELWKTDGTNVNLAADINTGPLSSYPNFLTEFNGLLYFQAGDGTVGAELWKYDGTNATVAADINPSGDSYPKNLTVFGSQLCFAADDGVHGWELWKFDGTNAQLISDLNISGDSFPENLIVLNGILYFTATTSETGYELWMYDGTNITLAADINPGSGDSFPQFLRIYNEKLYFRAANDGISNWELWSFTPPTPQVQLTPDFVAVEIQGTNIRMTWTTSAGSRNIVQASDDVAGPYLDLSPEITPTGVGEVTAEFVDIGAVSRSGSRFYRIKRL